MSAQDQLDVLLDGLTFAEAPRWRDGKLWFSDFYSHRVMCVGLDGRAECKKFCAPVDPRRQALVCRGDPVAEREVAREQPGRQPGEEEPEDDREPEAEASPPPPRAPGGSGAAVRGRSFPRRPAVRLRERRDLALHASPAVDAVGLLAVSHRAGYRSRRM